MRPKPFLILQRGWLILRGLAGSSNGGKQSLSEVLANTWLNFGEINFPFSHDSGLRATWVASVHISSCTARNLRFLPQDGSPRTAHAPWWVFVLTDKRQRLSSRIQSLALCCFNRSLITQLHDISLRDSPYRDVSKQEVDPCAFKLLTRQEGRQAPFAAPQVAYLSNSKLPQPKSLGISVQQEELNRGRSHASWLAKLVYDFVVHKLLEESEPQTHH